jgi:hypothetical protein
VDAFDPSVHTKEPLRIGACAIGRRFGYAMLTGSVRHDLLASQG